VGTHITMQSKEHFGALTTALQMLNHDDYYGCWIFSLAT